MTAFKSSVFPIIFAIVLLSFVEKGLKRLFLILLEAELLLFLITDRSSSNNCYFGPLGSMLSDTIANFYMSLYKFNPTIAGGFIGAIAQVLVILVFTGTVPYYLLNIEKFGFDTILAVLDQVSSLSLVLHLVYG